MPSYSAPHIAGWFCETRRPSPPIDMPVTCDSLAMARAHFDLADGAGSLFIGASAMLSTAHDRHLPHPQLLHHRPHRPRQVDPVRPADPAVRQRLRPGDEGADPRLDGHRARARHHHQGADRAPRLQGQGRQDLSAQPDGHAGPRRLRLRGVALASPPARARCWSSTPARAWRRRRSPTSTRRSTTTSRSCPSSTRSTCRRPTPTASSSRSRT